MSLIRSINKYAYIKARGVVIKENIINDKDKSLIILSKDYGKLNVWAKNSRSAQSKLLAGSTLFTYGDFIINSSNTHSSSNFNNTKNLFINQVDIIRKFYDISKDLYKIAVASYIIELTERNVQDALEVNSILFLLINCLNKLNNSKVDDDNFSILISKIYELKFLELNGYKPEIFMCSECGLDNNFNNNGDNNFKKIYFNVNGYVCNRCKNNIYNNNLICVNKNIVKALEYIFKSDIQQLFSFGVSDIILNDLDALSKMLLDYNLQTPPSTLKSRRFLDSMKSQQF
ncbi:MAG: DNA repair protein RecO [bacterium]